MRKRAYGGNLDGNPYIEYDRTWLLEAPDDIKEYKDRERFEGVVRTLAARARDLKNPNKIIIGDSPVHTITLSKEPYGEGVTIDSKDWVKRVNKAVKGYDLKDIKDLSQYGYIQYNADPDSTGDSIKMPSASQLGIGVGVGTLGLAALVGAYKLFSKHASKTVDLIPEGTTLWDIEDKDINAVKKKYAGHPKLSRLLALLKKLDDLNNEEFKIYDEEEKALAPFTLATSELDKKRQLHMKPFTDSLDKAWGNVYRVLAAGGVPTPDVHKAYTNARKAYDDAYRPWHKHYAEIDRKSTAASKPYAKRQEKVYKDRFDLLDTEI